MSRDKFDSSSALSEWIVFSKIYFGDMLSYIGISELACSASELIGLYMKYKGLSLNKFSIMLQFSLFCFR